MRVRVLLLVALGILLPLGLRSYPVPADGPEPNKNIGGKKDAPAKIDYLKKIRPLLQKYCTGCHGGLKPKADLNLEIYSDEASALKQKNIWEKAAGMLRSGEMPPDKNPRPAVEEHELILQWIDQEVFKVDCNMPVEPGKLTIRRLNKSEYNNTVRDLFGLDLKPGDDFPEDDVGYGFDNIGDVLTLSPLLLEKYLKASEKIVEAVWNNPQGRKQVMFKELGGKYDTPGAREILQKFGRKVYRRNLDPEEVDKLMKLVQLAETKEKSTEKGIRLAVQAMLMSPFFLFHVEKDRKVEPGQVGHFISDYELASRLSYFLWSSLPDEELFDLAEKKELRQPGMIEKQVKRMLADAKAKALVENFAGQWLQLRKLQKHTPDPDIYPKFDEALRTAMIKETELFFETIIKEDRSIYDLLDADFTFVNERLAKHYGLEGVKGKEFQKVKLLDGMRGGILTHASVLTVTSNPTRTSPVNRGKWILDNLLNAPPPPPPDVPELGNEKEEVLKGSLRQRMELHRKKAECAGCHNRMDPLGFGLENFDGVGTWRTMDGKFKVDASGELPTGEKFNGAKELQLVLKTKKGAEFRRCLAEKMLIYALGRGLTYYDRCAVDKICQTLQENQNRFSSLVQGVVSCDPFQKRKGKVKSN